MERLSIVHETEFGQEDTCITTLVLDWDETWNNTQVSHLMHHAAKKCVNDGARYQFVSQSQFPPDWDNYSWDYTNCDGFGSSSFFTSSWQEYCEENNLTEF
tara:strand:+ start:620 stop:922 length:303 start_codon:yes stop_codon:yes gene_type:complete